MNKKQLYHDGKHRSFNFQFLKKAGAFMAPFLYRIILGRLQKRHFFSSLFIALPIAFGLIFPAGNSLASSDSPKDLPLLKGITKVYLAFSGSGDQGVAPKGSFSHGREQSARFLEAVRGVMAPVPNLTVQYPSDNPAKQPDTLDSLLFNYHLSLRLTTVNGKPLKLGSLVLQIWKTLGPSSNTVIMVNSISYPFVVPDDLAAYEEEITRGITYLTEYLPSYINCANRRTFCGNLASMPGEVVKPQALINIEKDRK